MPTRDKMIGKWAVDLTNSIQEIPECIETRELMIAHFELWGKRLFEQTERYIKSGK